jgi:hypothetical protein
LFISKLKGHHCRSNENLIFPDFQRKQDNKVIWMKGGTRMTAGRGLTIQERQMTVSI